MKRVIPTLAFLAFLPAQALAHDFWIAPSNFQLDAPQAITLDFKVGHVGDIGPWPLSSHRVVSLKSHGPEGIIDHQAAIGDEGTSGSVQIRYDNPGVYLVAIESTHATSELDPEAFNIYVEEEGITPIAMHRAGNALADQPGREIYSRRGKAMVQIGELPAEDPAYLLKPLGLTLEIVPLVNPYRLEPNEEFRFEVRYRGRPLSGAMVHIVSLDTLVGDVGTLLTDESGQASIDRPSVGEWMLHTGWSDPIEDHSDGDYDTTFSSLTFGFERGQ